MSAVELVKHVKALPAAEREEFFLALLNLDEPAPSKLNERSKRVKWPDVQARARRIFGKRVFPNLVLLDRAEEGY